MLFVSNWSLPIEFRYETLRFVTLFNCRSRLTAVCAKYGACKFGFGLYEVNNSVGPGVSNGGVEGAALKKFGLGTTYAAREVPFSRSCSRMSADRKRS